MKIDLHNHFCHGFRPGAVTLKEVIDTSIARGLDAVGLTDFNQEGYQDNRWSWIVGEGGALMANFSKEYEELFSGNYAVGVQRGRDKTWAKLYLIRSQEVHTQGPHVLVVGAERDIQPEQTLEYTIAQAKEYGGIIIADHPFFLAGMSTRDLLTHMDDLDAIEGHNPFTTEKSRAMAKAIARKYQKTWIASSDAHCRREIGRNYTQIIDPKKDFESEEQLREHIRKCLREGWKVLPTQNRIKKRSIVEYVMREVPTQAGLLLKRKPKD